MSICALCTISQLIASRPVGDQDNRGIWLSLDKIFTAKLMNTTYRQNDRYVILSICHFERKKFKKIYTYKYESISSKCYFKTKMNP